MRERVGERAVKQILIPTGGSGCATRAVVYAAYLANQIGAATTILYVAETHFRDLMRSQALNKEVIKKLLEQGRATTAKAAEIVRDRGVQEVAERIEEGHPGEEITRIAKLLDVDLIVMGAHGRRGIERVLMGSVAREVANTSDVPLLLVK